MLGKSLADVYDDCCLYYRDKTAMVFGDRRLTFGDLERLGSRLAHSFKRLGLKRVDRLGVLMPNCPEVILVDYACAKIGIGNIPLAVYLQTGDMAYILEETECRAVVYHSAFGKLVEAVRPEAHGVDCFVCLSPEGKVPEGDHDFNELTADGLPDSFPSESDEDDLWAVIYTGGTTGKPKGGMHSYRTLMATVVMELLDFGIERNDIFLAVTPLTHASRVLVYPTFMRGGSCVIAAGFRSRPFLDTIQKERVTSAFVVPTMIYALLDYPEREQYDISSLKNVIYGAAPIAPERLKEAIRTFGPIFTQLYGQVEAPMALTAFPRDEHPVEGQDDSRLASCGRPSMAVKIKLTDENGEEAPPGQPGEITVKSPNAMLGYLKNPEATAEALKDGWVHTGDIGRQDEDGFIYLVDRKKDMIVSGGFNVFPKEIEDILHLHPAVAQAAVVGVPDDKWGEAVKAVVKLKPGQTATQEELIALCKEKKGSVMAPKSVDFVDSIAVTPLGKPDKKAIREPYWKDRARRVG